jgi:hypothetical protein
MTSNSNTHKLVDNEVSIIWGHRTRKRTPAVGVVWEYFIRFYLANLSKDRRMVNKRCGFYPQAFPVDLFKPYVLVGSRKGVTATGWTIDVMCLEVDLVEVNVDNGTQNTSNKRPDWDRDRCRMRTLLRP